MWRCRARLPNVHNSFLKIFDDYSYASRRLSPRHWAITRELTETVFPVKFWESGGVGILSGSCLKMGYSILSNDLSSPALRRLHAVISDFRPPSGTESGEAALRTLLARRAVGGYALTSDDLAPGEVARVHGQPAGKEAGSESGDESGPLLVPTSARVVSGRLHHRLRIPTYHMICRDETLEKWLMERRAVRTLAARQCYETALRTFLT